MLTKAELKTFLYLIDRAANELSKNSCNDLRLLADCKLTRDEAQGIRELEHAYCDNIDCKPPLRDDSEPEVYAIDWLVLRARAAKLKTVCGGVS